MDHGVPQKTGTYLKFVIFGFKLEPFSVVFDVLFVYFRERFVRHLFQRPQVIRTKHRKVQLNSASTCARISCRSRNS